MWTKSASVRPFNSTRIGSRPCSSGNRSEGLATWNAPDAMKRIWSVFTGPYFVATVVRSEEHTSELQSLMRISYAVFCLKKKKKHSKMRVTQEHKNEITDINK